MSARGNLRFSWKTRFGFYLLALGSASGLGNLWRFPYVVGQNGGGAFILAYTFLALTLGSSLVVAELILGKSERAGILRVGRLIAQRSGRWARHLGVLSIGMSLVVLSYYSIISGWVLYFLAQFVAGFFEVGFLATPEVTVGSGLFSNVWLQFLLSSAHILFLIVVVSKEFHEGIEKWLHTIVPLFGLLVLILFYHSFQLSTRGTVFRFLFYPDFSKLSWDSLLQAIGQVLFTLSIGFGTLVTYGSYMRESVSPSVSGFWVVLVDTAVSLISAMIIFPIAFQATHVPLNDPALMFEVLPQYMNTLVGGQILGTIFFLCLYFAALNASIGLLEVVVANAKESLQGVSRIKVTWLSGATLLFLTLFPVFLGKLMTRMGFGEQSAIVVIDSILVNWCLPIIAVGIALAFVSGFPRQRAQQFFLSEVQTSNQRLYSHWIFVLKWLVPAIVVFALVLRLIGMLG